ncbi:MAG: LLM class flavin-dependent oxidoreductase [Deltaproteobacteria bacterium]|nr:LLM class flavin-dependent oxidoreductase [Deltaproteobacteria bacterium]
MTKIGLVTPYWNNITKQEFIEIARLAEDLGYDSIWVPEMWGRDAFSILGLLASHTKRIKLATGIISVYSRTPAIIAQSVATLDEISDGRMILGLGTSGPVVIENWHGMPYEKSLQRTREYVEIIRMILNSERVNYEGEIFNLKNFRLQFKPIKKNIPIFIAAMGSKNIKLTGEISDGWIPFLLPPGHLQNGKKELLSGAENVGRNAGQIEVSPYIPAAVSSDENLAKSIIKEYIAYYVGGMGTFYHSAMVRYGFQAEADMIVDRWSKGDKSGAIESVTDEMVDSLSICGSAEGGRSKIAEYIDNGADLPIILFPPKASRELVRETIESLAP